MQSPLSSTSEIRSDLMVGPPRAAINAQIGFYFILCGSSSIGCNFRKL
jgi:hypothetical protein